MTNESKKYKKIDEKILDGYWDKINELPNYILLKIAFETIDSNGGGDLKFEEIIFSPLGKLLGPICEQIDYDQNKIISYSEWIFLFEKIKDNLGEKLFRTFIVDMLWTADIIPDDSIISCYRLGKIILNSRKRKTHDFDNIYGDLPELYFIDFKNGNGSKSLENHSYDLYHELLRLSNGKTHLSLPEIMILFKYLDENEILKIFTKINDKSKQISFNEFFEYLISIDKKDLELIMKSFDNRKYKNIVTKLKPNYHNQQNKLDHQNITNINQNDKLDNDELNLNINKNSLEDSYIDVNSSEIVDQKQYSCLGWIKNYFKFY